VLATLSTGFNVLLHDGSAYALGCRGLVEAKLNPSPTSSPPPLALPTDAYSLPYVAHWSGGNINNDAGQSTIT
jgi:hypothetical protein